MGATDNHAKERDGWQVDGHPDGTRSWHHPCSGLTIRTVSATRRLRLRDDDTGPERPLQRRPPPRGDP